MIGRTSFQLPDGKILHLESDASDHIFKQLFWKGIMGYEYESIIIYYEIAKKCQTIIDIGANIGYFSLIGGIASDKGKVIGFEPLPKAYDVFKNNIKLNKLSNVIPEFFAITNYNGNTKLYAPKGDIPMSSSIVKGFREEVLNYNVPAITLDTYCKNKNFKRIDMIKIDIEGGEYFALEGMKDILSSHEPIIICEILGGSNTHKIQKLLKDNNYNYFLITNRGLEKMEIIQKNINYLNYLFAKKSHYSLIKKYVHN